MKLVLKQYQKLNKIKEKAFVQLKDGETGEPAYTDEGEMVGFTIYSSASDKFKRAALSTVHLDLTKQEKARKKAIAEAAEDCKSPSVEDLDFLSNCDKKTTERTQLVYAMVVESIHHLELDKDVAESIGVKTDKKGAIICEPENLHALFIAFPDLSAQIGDAINTASNFTKS